MEIIGTVYVLMWPRYGSTVNSAHSNTILENSVFETYGLLSMVPYDTGGRVAITIWGINPSFEKSKILYRRVDVSPTDVSPTENSWMLRPLNIASLGYCAPDRCVPTLDRFTDGQHNAWVSRPELRSSWVSTHGPHQECPAFGLYSTDPT